MGSHRGAHVFNELLVRSQALLGRKSRRCVIDTFLCKDAQPCWLRTLVESIR